MVRATLAWWVCRLHAHKARTAQRLVASVRPPAGHERASPGLPLTTHLDLGLPAQYKHTALHATAALVALATALLFCFSKLLGVLPAC